MPANESRRLGRETLRNSARHLAFNNELDRFAQALWGG